ncbi:uncharacterized protein [Dermacentor andersoni]|uniref:uncharacterized protein isoform X1 n=1 Tax=Dermacentor andersoni TaxID=34620 RepID=UPI002415CB5B|nr:uncharacterized protein LOC129385937 isoform X1 [Dermacentor andersoni]
MTFLLVHWLLSAILSVCSLEIPEKDLSAANELQSYEDPSEVLKSHQDVYLFRAPPHGWSRSNSMCMKSQFLSFDKAKGEYRRTLYYWGIHVTKPTFGPKNLTLLMRIKKRGDTKTFIEAVEVGGKGNLSFPLEEEPETTELPKKQSSPVEQRNVDDQYGVLYHRGVNRIGVLYATSKCILLGSRENGMAVDCTLWVLQSSLEDPPRRCKFAQLALCAPRAYNAYKTEKKYCDFYNNITVAWGFYWT